MASQRQTHRLLAELPRNALLRARLPQIEVLTRSGAARRTKTDHCDQARIEAILPGLTPLADVSTDTHKIREVCGNTQCRLLILEACDSAAISPFTRSP